MDGQRQGGGSLAEFLRARRSVTTPQQVGLLHGGNRRTPGLRREEVAMLAGVSTDYYVRLEQGREHNPSAQVLDALGRVFALDADALVYLHRLVHRSSRPRRSARARSTERAGTGVLRLLDAWQHTPVLVLGRRLDVLAGSDLARALFSVMEPDTNLIRFTFLDPTARDFYGDWDEVARNGVAVLRAGIGHDLDDPRLTSLVGELSLKSREFCRLWARHDVRAKTHGTKTFRHPQVGGFTLAYESFRVNSAPGQQLVVYRAEPNTPAEEALRLLDTLAADLGTTGPSERGRQSAGTPDGA
ncbi:helix-turn-helix transcriptional regulator [Streptomyces sp. ME02-6987-2C]|uniref:helix-turn-helix domain-containing protein n=1 Tax=unclassified Streptomyces TaxID=2593676 RepID=UPI0029BCBA83|nr:MULTISPECIES: helix-turn-helix transcriptional regulator [unclassified Streptomyces]MDX3366107.1 helix-turn-helix transcriptional regulator [Streptomyces sp. ME02-6987-2C]MDX3426388.1 helix-turn-helix transcriptional regulator [Streptomyces sp. ME02-6985-2c]